MCLAAGIPEDWKMLSRKYFNHLKIFICSKFLPNFSLGNGMSLFQRSKTSFNGGARVGVFRSPAYKFSKKAAKRIVPLALGLYFIPIWLAIYAALGLMDFLRNTRRTWNSFDRYFAGNGVITWLLSPFNLLMDLLTLPFRNKGIYRLSDLPRAYQEEIQTIIAAAHQSDLIGKLETKLGEKKRGMIFFKWYGKNVQTSVAVPEYHQAFKYIRTIGVSIFNTRQSTGKHFGPLRITLRVLYNINQINSDKVFVKVGGHTHYWRDNKLFIFDDTLQHQSCNQSEEVRYCLFLDILRPSLCPRLLGGILSSVRMVMARVNYLFYKHWAFIK
jgi:beta-hydroxylase